MHGFPGSESTDGVAPATNEGNTAGLAAPVVETTDNAHPAWGRVTNLVHRFFAVYFLFYVSATQMLGSLVPLPGIQVPELGNVGPIRWLVEQTALHLFGVTTPLVVTGSGSGDKMFDWVLAFCLVVLAAITTVIWSALSRSDPRAAAWRRWFRVFLRCALGATYLTYGASKVIPVQMSFPSLTRLLEPYGHFSPMGVLWGSIGASPAYEIFTGSAEIAAGVLLFIPGTQLLGALVSLACAIQIFTLNMTYDVPVKLFSSHLVLMSLFLIAPEARRLLAVLVFNRQAEPSVLVSIGRTPRVRHIATWLQVAYGALLLSTNLYGSTQAYRQYGGGREKSPLFGIWNVVGAKMDGVEEPRLVTEKTRWRRVVFDSPLRMSVQLMDDTFTHFTSKIDPARKSVTLSNGDPKWGATLAVERIAADRLALSGPLDGRQIELRLEIVPRENYLLVTRGFNWIQDYPFNR